MIWPLSGLEISKKCQLYAKLLSQDTSILLVETGCIPAFQGGAGK